MPQGHSCTRVPKPYFVPAARLIAGETLKRLDIPFWIAAQGRIERRRLGVRP